MQITKAQVIQALKEEPILKAGDWIHAEVNAGLPRYHDKCPVCAVGAVMRQAGVEAFDIRRSSLNATDGRGYDTSDVDESLRDGYYLGALSAFFEMLCAQEADYLGVSLYDIPNFNQYRSDCIEFVQTNFPAGVIYDDKVDIDA